MADTRRLCGPVDFRCTGDGLSLGHAPDASERTCAREHAPIAGRFLGDDASMF